MWTIVGQAEPETSRHHAAAGIGTAGFSDCTFTEWGSTEGNRPAIQTPSGTVLVRITNESEGNVQTGLNAGD